MRGVVTGAPIAAILAVTPLHALNLSCTEAVAGACVGTVPGAALEAVLLVLVLVLVSVLVLRLVLMLVLVQPGGGTLPVAVVVAAVICSTSVSATLLD